MTNSKKPDTGLTDLSADSPSEYPFAESPFEFDEPNPPEIGRDQVVTHTTVGGRGVVGRLRK